MRKYKINRDRGQDLPKDEVVNKYKNFDQFRMQYDDITKRNKTPLYKNKKLFLLLLLIGLVAWVVSLEMEKDTKTEDSEEKIEQIDSTETKSELEEN